MKINRYLLGSTLVAALGGFLFGFDTAVISGATEALRKVFGLTSNELGFTVASALIGTVLVLWPPDALRKSWAAKPTEMAGGFLFCLRRRLCLGLELVCFAALPFPGGIGHWRGLRVIPHADRRDFARRETRPISGRQPAEYCAGNSGRADLFYYVIAALLDTGTTVEWRWMLGVVAIPAALFFLFLLPIPESPRWLVKQHRRDEASDHSRPFGESQYGKRFYRRLWIPCTRRRSARSSRFFRRNIIGRFCWPSWWPPLISFPESMP